MLFAHCSSNHFVCFLPVRNPLEQFYAVLILTVAKMIAGGPIKAKPLHST